MIVDSTGVFKLVFDIEREKDIEKLVFLGSLFLDTKTQLNSKENKEENHWKTIQVSKKNGRQHQVYDLNQYDTKWWL